MTIKKVSGMLCGFAMAAGMLPAHAADEGKRDERLKAATGILDEIMGAPDKQIPQSILAKAHCVIVIPAETKLAFGVGAQYGQGMATCRTGHGWSAPVFMTLGGGSFGFQIGGQATDLVLLGMNAKSGTDLLHSKVKLGADAAAAAGPVGRDANANTDLYLNAEYLTYSRSKGLFAGLDLTGDYLNANAKEQTAEYGSGIKPESILRGAVPVPANAQPFVKTVAKYFVEAKASR